jgi:hypothetical protein
MWHLTVATEKKSPRWRALLLQPPVLYESRRRADSTATPRIVKRLPRRWTAARLWRVALVYCREAVEARRSTVAATHSIHRRRL